MNVLDGDVNIIEQVRIEFNGIAGRHEDHDLLLQVLSQEGEEQLELISGVNYNVALLEGIVG